MTTVLVCDDAPLAREALRRAIASIPGVERVTAAGSGEEVLARYPLERPGVVLMDVRMPGMGGVEATRRLLAAHPGAIVLMLTLGEDAEAVAAAVVAGARGYLVKDATREETATVLDLATARPVQRGGNVVALPVRHNPTGPALSERELEVLEGMSRGKSNAQIGRELYLSEDTVKTHARRLFRKMGAADRAQAVALGFRWGLLS
ncbi:MAG: response regulator transcription factor [Candidatus Nanopelagicales bacterium]|jgi:DNA-binding NarL/FixJ family response regulator|nr:response regulator transcription factor [Candidatus Nanopelagicales bacterium]